MKKFTLRDAAFYALILVILVGTLWTLQNMNTGEKPTYAQVRRALEQQQVETVLVDKNNNLTMLLKDGSTLTYELYSFELFYEDFNDTEKRLILCLGNMKPLAQTVNANCLV